MRRHIRWGWFQISVANFVVVAIMMLVFILAIVIPFPKGRNR
jgi:bacteriorhodopsin